MNSLRTSVLPLFVLLAATLAAAPAAALEKGRLLRMPDIQGDRIVFVYGGDLWTVARTGGMSVRLTSSDGQEVWPKFSPDGQTIAFTGEYDGNLDAFTIPIVGGEPNRLTSHPSPDQVAEWYPDGKSILLRSRRASAINRYDRFFRVPAAGGFQEMLALPTGGYATFSGDAKQIAFVSPSYDNRTWKRYRGGNAPQIWTHDFPRNVSTKITDWAGPNEWPMWHDNTIYYCSDRGGRTTNLWAYDQNAKSHRQVTRFDDYDVKWPSLGSDAIVFEKGGSLWVMDLPGERTRELDILVPDDKPFARATYRNVSNFITEFDLSPSAKRAVFAARGDLFTVPAEKGDVRLLTQTPGARERDPVWSPDGKWIAYLSDQTGEYEIWVVAGDGRSAPRQVTKNGGVFRFGPLWSPDSKKLAFSDKARDLWWVDVSSGRLTRVDHGDYAEIHDFSFSPDSRWLAYNKANAAGFSMIHLHSLDRGVTTVVSNGMTDDFNPKFDPDGNYLYFVSRRTLQPEFGIFDFDFEFSATDKVYAASLRDTLTSPLPPPSDEEGASGGGGKAEEEKKDGDKAGADSKKSSSSDPKPMVVHLQGLADRVAEVPVPPGRYSLAGVYKGKIVMWALDPPSFDDGPRTGSFKYFDTEKRELKTVISGVNGSWGIAKDGSKLLYKAKDQYGIVEVADGKKVGDGKLSTSELKTTVDPRQEWAQMFDEAWRLERDFYYDPGMGGLDWDAIGDRYRRLVPYVAHRGDLNYILGEMIGELSTSHAYVGGGETPNIQRVEIGLLGADYELDDASDRYRFKKVYRARDWNSKVEAPLGMPGVLVEEGDYLLAVNEKPLRAPDDLYLAFVGTAGKSTRITVGKTPGDPRPRTYVVRPVANEGTLRYREWVDANRQKVAEATDGRVAYIHVPNTAHAGIQEFTKQFYPQVDREALIVDERFNGGGFVPDFFTNRLSRTTNSYVSFRDGVDVRVPGNTIDGPKVMLVNQYAGSGGDLFPYFFRQSGLGPVIGMRTWGGLVGISHDLPLVDGGAVTIPDVAFWDGPSRQWVVENHGVEPDIEVENSPADMVAGRDPQLERAIQWTLAELAKNPPRKPLRPPYKVQEGLPQRGPASTATSASSASK